MKARFYINETEVLAIPLQELTIENRLWYLDMLAADYGVNANSIKVRINY